MIKNRPISGRISTSAHILALMAIVALSLSNCSDNRDPTGPSGQQDNSGPDTLLTEDFEDSELDSLITLRTAGSFSTSAGVRETSAFGSTRAFGFGVSTCGSNCYYSYATRLVITLPESTYVSAISFNEMEVYGNWGSAGKVEVDGENLTSAWFDFSRPPYNDHNADTSFRHKSFEIDRKVTTLSLYVWDITRVSECFIDDLVVIGEQ